MTLKAKVANALSFAHMAGLGRSKAGKAEEEEEKKDAKKAEEESEQEKAKADEGEDDEKKKDDGDEKSNKAKKAEKKDNDNDGDDDDGETMSAQHERARCKAIVAHGVKTSQVMHACAYAFDTSMSAEAAIATMDANLAVQPSKAATATLAGRMSGVNTPVIQPEVDQPAAGSAASVAAMVIAAAAKARGEKS